ncbi:MAG: PAS domain S-box protein [Candidatus Thiodiazotropha sp. (ex. Lucinisca nassula)]|nr:PAS domain S-box protein [Candidatus Thiodiazotropha sp. (ex. Lucinisca nassula)]
MKRSLIRKYGRIFALMFVPPVALLFGVSAWLYNTDIENGAVLTRQSEMLSLNQSKSVFEQLLQGAIQDLMFIAAVDDLRQLAIPSASDRYTELLALDFKSMAEKKGQFDQIRYLNAEGKEVVRVNYRNGMGVIVPDTELQDKGGRYYFTETMSKGRDEVFVSPLDLNMEHGEIEMPFKPMIRLATPVFDASGNKRGMVIINYLADKLINLLDQGLSPSSSQMLLNKEGYWLKGETKADEWGFMFPDKKGLKISNRYADAWKQMTSADSGQFTTADGLFSYTTVEPEKLLDKLDLKKETINSAVAGTVHWKLVRFITDAELDKPAITLGKRYLAVNALLVSILGVVALLLSRAKLFKIDAQQQLHEKEERISEIVNSAFDAIITINERGVIETFNPAACTMFGYLVDEIIGEKVNILMASPDREYHDLHILNYIDTGVGKFVGKPGRVTGVKSDGTTIQIEICIGAKKIKDHWLFTAICRQYQEEQRQVEVG